VTDAGDDVAARGRAIFQRLRAQTPFPSSPPAPDVREDDDADDPSPSAAYEPVVVAAPAADEAPASPDLLVDPRPAEEEEQEAFEELVAEAVAEGVVVEPVPPARAPLPGRADLPPLEDLGGAGAEPIFHPEDAAEHEVVGVRAAPESFARPLPRIMAVANQKGGVGKTTTAVNLGACLADLGYRVLIVDLDPQGNASTGVGINIRDLQGSMYDVILHDLSLEDCVEATSVRNLFCAPSSLDLAGAEIELVPAFSRELRLKRALDEVRDDYDFVLIDCPPSLGLLTVNALAAATEVVVPIQCEYYALEGLGQLLRNVNLVQKNLNQALEVSAIILVMYDARTKLADQVVTEVREHFGDKVCRHVVPRTVRLSEAPSFGQPIIAFDSSSRGAIAYKELAKEVSGGTPQRAR
jgi:chromosome partitioning protein